MVKIINPYVMKKYVSLFLVGICTALPMFVILSIYGNLVLAGVFMFVGLVTGIIIANVMLYNPFTAMLEGKGLLAMDINSTGIIRTFLVNLKPPYVKGNIGKEKVVDVFDRETVCDLELPRKEKGLEVPQVKYTDDGKLKINIDYEAYNKSRFRMLHYPVLIFNSHLGSLLDKQMISKLEKETFAAHSIIFLNKKVEELTSVLTHFSRQVIELMRPKSSAFDNPVIRGIVIFIIIFAFLAIGYMFLKPMIMGSGSNPFAAATGAIDAISQR